MVEAITVVSLVACVAQLTSAIVEAYKWVELFDSMTIFKTTLLRNVCFAPFYLECKATPALAWYMSA